MTTAHVGIVVCSAEGAALCYKTICEADATVEVSMHTPAFERYVAALEAGNWAAVGEIMLESANKLAAIGAEFLICPDNTVHAALPLVEARSPLPWLHIAEAVLAEAKGRGYKRLGLLGTRWLVESDVYPESCERPSSDERDEIHRIIMDELVRGVFKPEAVAYHRRAIARMKERGCDAVVLGCTEIPLIIDDANSPLPTLDSTRLLARAALKRASSR